jgi:hypothetical protein
LVPRHPLSLGRLCASLGAITLALSALPACKRSPPSPSECTEMLDRYLDMTIAADPTLASLPPSQGKVARDMKRELKKGEKSFRQVEEQCQREVSRAEYNCAMKAPSPNEWEACIE